MNKPHNQAEFIKLWADGETIQFRPKDWHNDEWFEVTDGHYWKDSLEYRIKPEPPKYPQTKMTEGDICSVYYNGGPVRGSDEELVAFYRIANAAIARSVRDGQVVTAEESKAAVDRAFEQAKSLARQGMVPAEMLEKIARHLFDIGWKFGGACPMEDALRENTIKKAMEMS